MNLFKIEMILATTQRTDDSETHLKERQLAASSPNGAEHYLGQIPIRRPAIGIAPPPLRRRSSADVGATFGIRAARQYRARNVFVSTPLPVAGDVVGARDPGWQSPDGRAAPRFRESLPSARAVPKAGGVEAPAEVRTRSCGIAKAVRWASCFARSRQASEAHPPVASPQARQWAREVRQIQLAALGPTRSEVATLPLACYPIGVRALRQATARRRRRGLLVIQERDRGGNRNCADRRHIRKNTRIPSDHPHFHIHQLASRNPLLRLALRNSPLKTECNDLYRQNTNMRLSSEHRSTLPVLAAGICTVGRDSRNRRSSHTAECS